ncbi:MAG: hypothetical protein D6796_15775 [Caldilineae bacterium]|nr:MAG: hypothetical protein D6796_15775 [Caldilineae bacterium]
MRRRAVLEVITPHVGVLHHMPRGFHYADKALSGGSVSDRLQKTLDADDETRWMRRCLSYLERRFQRWLRVQLIEPLSLPGLVRIIRYRIRSYPTFIMGGQTYSGQDLAELEAFIRRQIGAIADDKSSPPPPQTP